MDVLCIDEIRSVQGEKSCEVASWAKTKDARKDSGIGSVLRHLVNFGQNVLNSPQAHICTAIPASPVIGAAIFPPTISRRAHEGPIGMRVES